MFGAEAFLINPPKRGSKRRTKSKGRKSAMARVRDSRGRYTKRRRTTARRRKTSTRARRRSYRRNPGVAELMLMNPPRKRRRGGKRRSRSRMRRFAGRARRYASKSLIPSFRGVMGEVQEGAFLAAGAVLTAQVYSRFVPDSLKTGPQKHAVRLAVAILGGRAVSKFVNPKLGRAFTLGGVATTLMIAANEYLGGAIVPMGGIEEMALSAYYAEPRMLSAPGMGAYYTPGMVSAQPDYLGWEADMPDRLSPGNRF